MGKLLSLPTFFAAAKKVTAAPHRGNANRPTRNRDPSKALTRSSKPLPPQTKQLTNFIITRLIEVDIKLPDAEVLMRPHHTDELIDDILHPRLGIERRNRQRRDDLRRMRVTQGHRRGLHRRAGRHAVIDDD